MAKIKTKPEYRGIVKMFDELTGSRSIWQVFNDCIEMYAYAIQNQFVGEKKYKANECLYKKTAEKYNEREMQTVVEIFGTVVEMLEKNPFRDLLGDLYMQLDMGSDALGQFFTPYHLSRLVAEMAFNVDEVKSIIAEQGYITVNEPTVGGGANIIAFCECLYNHHINYQNQCVIIAQDLSRTTALMCYVVLSLIGCSAVIKIGDTLADPFTNYYAEVKKGAELWTTPMFHINNCYTKV